MAGSTFKKRDLNRFKKIYPYIRRKPVQNYLVGSEEVVIEAGSVEFDNTSGPVEHTFSETFSSAPTVTATAVDSSSNSTAAVNIFIKSVSTTSVSFQSSSDFTGTVDFQAILIVE